MYDAAQAMMQHRYSGYGAQWRPARRHYGAQATPLFARAGKRAAATLGFFDDDDLDDDDLDDDDFDDFGYDDFDDDDFGYDYDDDDFGYDDYGANPLKARIDALASQIARIAGKYVRAYQVSKIAKLMGLGNSRDKLIKDGYASDSWEVTAIDDKARNLIRPSVADDARAQNIAWQRDDLIREAVQKGIHV